MPPVSVIIPAHNCETTLEDTIQSVLSQTFSAFELIIIESGSTDSTPTILKSFQDPRITVFSYPLSPVSINRNRGASHATGNFLAFLDADDLWQPDKLDAQYQALQDNPEAALVYSWTNCIDEQGNFLRRGCHVACTGDVLEVLLLDDFIGSGSNAMVKRQAFWQVGSFDETLTNAEDTDLWLRIALQYPFAVVPRPQVLYRIRANSKSSNVQRMEVCNLKVIQKAYALAPKQYYYLKPHSIANLYKYLLYRALEVNPGQQQTRLILKFICQTVYTDKKLLVRKVVYKSILKLFVLTCIPKAIASATLNRFSKIFNTSTLLGYRIRSIQKIQA